MMQVKAGIIVGYGINAELELGRAFESAGAAVRFIHAEDLVARPDFLTEMKIIAFPGGFSYGDHLGSGKVLSHYLYAHLKDQMLRFISEDKLMIGICNGFQMIVRMGLVPNISGLMLQEASLLHNEGGLFIDRWVKVKVNHTTRSPWLRGIDSIRMPIRHGEGCLILKDQAIADTVRKKALAALYYEGENPNGSWEAVAGLTDTSGKVIGLMPHPEAALEHDQDPGFKSGFDNVGGPTAAMRIFLNAVHYYG